MNKIYIVTRETRNGNVIERAFSSKEKADVFCKNYLYNKSTLEDRTYNKIQIDKCSFGTTDYSLYTSECGDITLTVKETNLD